MRVVCFVRRAVARRTASVEMWQVPSVATRKMYVDPAAGVEVCGGAPR